MRKKNFKTSFAIFAKQICKCSKSFARINYNSLLLNNNNCTAQSVMTRPSFASIIYATHLKRKFNILFCLLLQMISLLPSKIIKLLEFIGFSGSKVMIYRKNYVYAAAWRDCSKRVLVNKNVIILPYRNKGSANCNRVIKWRMVYAMCFAY